MSGDANFSPNALVVAELDRVNKVWKNLVENIHEKPNKDRVTAILVQVMIEYYIDRILIIRQVGTPAEIYDMTYRTTLERLRGLNLIDQNLEDDLIDVIYQIRNIYAHEIEVEEETVLNLINSVKSVSNTSRFTDQERVDKVTGIILRQVQRVFMNVLVREQENSEANNQ